MDRMEQGELTNALKQIIYSERETESIKIELALKSDFNILDAFRMLDFRSLGSFTAADLIEALTRHLGFKDFAPDDVYMFFKKHDRHHRGRINLQEFSTAYLPFSREYASLVTDRCDYYSSRGCDFNYYFTPETRRDMCAVWSALFRAERTMEQIRRSLTGRPYLNIREAFDFCARQRAGMVCADSLREVLANVGFYATEREIQGLFYRLDRDRDGVISAPDWVDEFTPALGRL